MKPSSFSRGWNASFRSFLSFKWTRLVSDQRIVFLEIIEMLLASGIGASIAIYLDPDWNVVPEPYNWIVFAVLVGVALLIHRRTRPFRVARRVVKKRKKTHA